MVHVVVVQMTINAPSVLVCCKSMIGNFILQAEDAIRAIGVTGVQTCALPILRGGPAARGAKAHHARTIERRGIRRREVFGDEDGIWWIKIGRASCRERV